MIDVSVLVDLADPGTTPSGGWWKAFGVSLVGFVLGLLGLVGAFNAFVIPAEPFRPGGRKDTGIRTLREVSWLVVLLVSRVRLLGRTVM